MMRRGASTTVRAIGSPAFRTTQVGAEGGKEKKTETSESKASPASGCRKEIERTEEGESGAGLEGISSGSDDLLIHAEEEDEGEQ